MKYTILLLLISGNAMGQTDLGDSGPFTLGPPYVDTGSPGLVTTPPKLLINADDVPCGTKGGQDILRLTAPIRTATSWRWTCNGDMLGSTTLTVSGNTANIISFNNGKLPPAATQYMVGITSDEYPVDPVLVVAGNQGMGPPGYDNTLIPRQPVILGVNQDRTHTFSLLANGRMGVGLENTWTGTFGSGTITTERLTEQIVIPNGSYLGARNADDTHTDKLIGYGSDDTVQIASDGQTTEFGGDVRVHGELIADQIRSLNLTVQTLQSQVQQLQAALAQHGTPVYHAAETATPAAAVVTVAAPTSPVLPPNCMQLGKSKLIMCR